MSRIRAVGITASSRRQASSSPQPSSRRRTASRTSSPWSAVASRLSITRSSHWGYSSRKSPAAVTAQP